MIRSGLIGISFCLCWFLTTAQEHGFEFGKVSYIELDMKVYDRDTSAVAVVLKEFGEAFFDLETLNTIRYQYHVKIKILKEQGKNWANFELVRRKSKSMQEAIRSIKASSFNRDGNSWKESALQSKNIFNENVNDDYALTKFAVPDVQVGSIVEVYYELETPFTFKFVPWEFQTDIPKVNSEFWAMYPAYYTYNITLKGFLAMTKNESSVIKQCSSTGLTDMGTAAGADCVQFKFGMQNIPAFKDEDYMTARSNFLSAINFELAQITHPDGRIDKITTEWKEAEKELKEHANFGVQVKRARKLFEDKVKEVLSAEKDQKAITQNLYNYFKGNYLWNGDYGSFTDQGVKKAFETKKGNVADINLSLLGALLEARINAEPVLLSTRSRGLPIKLHPVLSDFNYVLVGVKFKDDYVLLDATDVLHPFGFIPERCLNGEGRAIWETSDWIPLKPNTRERISYDLKLKLMEPGEITGAVTIKHEGYAAFNTRRLFFNSSDDKDYMKKKTSGWSGLEISNFTIENERDLDKPFIEKFDIRYEEPGTAANIIYYQPFLFNRIEKNPFTSTERLYPVDFGAPADVIYFLSLEIPETYVIEDVPENIAAALPTGGGRFLFSTSKLQDKITMTCTFNLTKSIYTSNEYHYLRELYARYISIQQSQFVLKKK